jgi:hypothetical protein
MIVVFGLTFVLLGRHASAFDNTGPTNSYPHGANLTDQWIFLSQYQCSGHCLETPTSYVRIFYPTSALSGDPNQIFRIDITKLCRYDGNAGSTLKLEDNFGNTPADNSITDSNPDWLADCRKTGGDKNNNYIETTTLAIKAKYLVPGGTKFPGYEWIDLHMHVDQLGGFTQPAVGAYVSARLPSAKVVPKGETDPTINYANSDCYTGNGGANYTTCTASGGPPRNSSNHNLFSLWSNYNDNDSSHKDTFLVDFKGDCSLTSAKTVNLRWYDADAFGSSGTQVDGLYFNLYDETMDAYVKDTNGNLIKDYGSSNANKLGGNDSYRDLSFVLQPNHVYTWGWHNVSATNGIQLWLPYSGLTNLDCSPSGSDNAQCLSITPSNPNPVAGTTISIRVVMKNTGTTTWTTAGGYRARMNVSGVLTDQNSGTVNPSANHAYTFGGLTNATAGGISYGFKMVHNGSVFPPAPNPLCSVLINWQPRLAIDCQNTVIRGNSSGQSYFLHFAASDGSVIFPNPGPLTPKTYSTFNDFPLAPHLSYDVTLVDTNGISLESQHLPQCMFAQCESSLVFNGAAVVEPGQQGNATYGIMLWNFTGKTFGQGTYVVRVSGQLGIAGGGDISKAFPPGGWSNFDGPFKVTANYEGYMHADLLFFNAQNLNNEPPAWSINCNSNPYRPQTRPTLRVTNGDISTGGGFASNNSCSSNFANGKPRYISPTSAGGTPQAGGLRTFAVPQSFQGSGGDFAAYALGYITGIAAGNDGFYSAAAKTGGKTYSDLMFSNLTGNGTNLGGLLGGEFTAAHCTPDYFNDTRLTELTPKNAVNVNVGSYSADTQELLKINGPQPCIRISGTMNPGVRLTIYTDEDVCIDGNITYSPWNIDTTNTTNEAPYLTIITKGNIYVQSNVSTITGLFIAQPEDDGINGGVFTSCANNASVADPAFIAANCHGAFTVKGSVIAQHIYPTRVGNGTMFNNTGLAETFDYAPSAAVGRPYLKPLCGGAAVAQCEESNANLPPVF